MTSRRYCKCGILRDDRGMCAHCDARRDCSKQCVHCAIRDGYCPICRLQCGTRAASAAHEKKCREAEIRARA